MYHYSPKTGKPEVCNAKNPESCPFGGYYHNADINAVQEFADKENEKLSLPRGYKLAQSIKKTGTVLIASTNKGKIREFEKIFNSKGIKVKSLRDCEDLPDVEETGATFEENALLKAKTISDLTGLPVLADDSGLCVKALNNGPGVYSARWAGEGADEKVRNTFLLNKLRGIKDRSAFYNTTLALVVPNEEPLIVEANWEGEIGYEEVGSNGFSYDTLFKVNGKTVAEMTDEEKNSQSQRKQAVDNLIKDLGL